MHTEQKEGQHVSATCHLVAAPVMPHVPRGFWIRIAIGRDFSHFLLLHMFNRFRAFRYFFDWITSLSFTPTLRLLIWERSAVPIQLLASQTPCSRTLYFCFCFHTRSSLVSSRPNLTSLDTFNSRCRPLSLALQYSQASICLEHARRWSLLLRSPPRQQLWSPPQQHAQINPSVRLSCSSQMCVLAKHSIPGFGSPAIGWAQISHVSLDCDNFWERLTLVGIWIFNWSISFAYVCMLLFALIS